MNNTRELNIINNEKESRFEIKLPNDYAFVDYRWRNDVLELMYIFVPVPYRGKGIAEELIKFVLDDALANNRKIVVYCSWIAGYVRSHPEYHSLMQKPGYR
jgi:predicted GNAT family acetyltransferase